MQRFCQLLLQCSTGVDRSRGVSVLKEHIELVGETFVDVLECKARKHLKMPFHRENIFLGSEYNRGSRELKPTRISVCLRPSTSLTKAMHVFRKLHQIILLITDPHLLRGIFQALDPLRTIGNMLHAVKTNIGPLKMQIAWELEVHARLTDNLI